MSTYEVMPVTAEDYRRLARKKLPRFLFDYIDGGAGEEETLASNREDFRRIRLLQRVLRDVSRVECGTSVLGRSVTMPLVLAPVGLAGMFKRRGEVQAARAASAAGVPFTTSTVGICPVEEVQAAAPHPVWFQLYMLRDRGVVRSLLERAAASGSDTLVFTVDLAVAGPRYRDFRNGMMGGGRRAALAKAWQLLTRPGWVLDVGVKGKPHDFGNLREQVEGAGDLEAFKAFVDSQFDPSVTWDDIAWLRTIWQGKLLIKGVMCREDALAAIDTGADGIVVSNHGGRQLDSVASCISKLPEIAEAAGERAEVYMDGGVRNGSDVVKAVALGARGVLIGRPWAWALAARGEQGVLDLLTVIRREIEISMALMGVNSIRELSPDLVEL